MRKSNPFEVVPAFRKTLVCGNRERLARRTSNKQPLEGSSYHPSKNFGYFVKSGNIAWMRWRPEHLPPLAIAPQCLAEKFVDLKSRHMPPASRFQSQIDSAATCEKAHNRSMVAVRSSVLRA